MSADPNSARDNPGGCGYDGKGPEQVLALSSLFWHVANGCTFEGAGTREAVVLGACINVLNHLVASAEPEGRDLVMRSLRASIDLIEVNARRTGH